MKTVINSFLTVAVMIAVLGCGGGKKTDVDGVYVGQSVSEFISIFGRKYKVEKATIFLEGENYNGYSVFENDEELFFVHTRFDNPDIVSAIRIISQQLKTEKGIGVGSTFAELQSKYETSGYAVVDGIYIKGFSARFELCKTEIPILPDGHLIRVIELFDDDVMVTTDKRIIARNAVETADAEEFTAGTTDETDATVTMTMTANVAEITIMLAGQGRAKIDWGDGRITETGELEEFNSYTFEGAQEYRHSYNSSGINVITITGALTMLRCINAGLTAIDVSDNHALQYLYCADNQLSALDVSHNNSLIELDVSNNQLTALNVSSNTELWNLHCSDNQLSELDVGNNTALYYLFCKDNLLRELNLKNNTALHGVDVSNNMFGASALNDIFETLHNNLVMGEGMITQWIRISVNPGTAECNQSIAKDKGWTVTGFTGAQLTDLNLVGRWISEDTYRIWVGENQEERNSTIVISDDFIVSVSFFGGTIVGNMRLIEEVEVDDDVLFNIEITPKDNYLEGEKAPSGHESISFYQKSGLLEFVYYNEGMEGWDILSFRKVN